MGPHYGGSGTERFVTLLDIFWWKHIFQVSFHISTNIYLFKHTPTHTVSRISTITQISYKHPVFDDWISSKSDAEKSRKHLVRRLWYCHYAPKKNRLRRRPPAALLPRQSNCSEPVHNQFLKTLYWTRPQLFTHCSLHSMVCAKKESPRRKTRLKKGKNGQKKIPRKEIKVPVTNECSVPIHEINHEIYKETIFVPGLGGLAVQIQCSPRTTNC